MSQSGSDVHARSSCNGSATTECPDESAGTPRRTPARLCKPRRFRGVVVGWDRLNGAPGWGFSRGGLAVVRGAAVLRGLYVLAGVCALAGVTLACSSTALAARAHVPGGTFGEPCTSEPCGNGKLNEPEGVAVNEATGDVYVADKGDNRVQYFNAGGTYLGQFNGSGLLPGEGTGAPSGQISGPTAVAVDNACQLHKPVLTEATTPTCHEFDPSAGDVYVFDRGRHLVDKFTETGEYMNQITTHNPNVNFAGIEGMAVDRNGFLWVWERAERGASEFFLGTAEIAKFSDGEVNEFLSGEVTNLQEPNANAPILAADPKGSGYYFYEDTFATAPTRLTGSAAGFPLVVTGGPTPRAVQEPIGQPSEIATGLTVEATSHDVYVDTGSQVTRYSPALAPLEQLGSGTLSEGGGIGVNNATESLYVADSTADDVAIFLPRPPGVPTIASQSVSAVTSESATFDASVDPQGSSTSYRIEYGATTAYGQSVSSAEEEVGSGYEAHEVAVPVQGLLAGTIYHFRVVATNSFGTAYGEDETLETQATGAALTLADERQWEMVSPPYKNGALFLGAGEPVEAAVDGDAFVGLASQPTEDSAEGSSGYVDVLMTRNSQGWSSKTISPAHTRDTAQPTGSEFSAFSEDLSHALVSPFGLFSQLSPEASEQTPYLRTNYLNGNVNEYCATVCYQPLVTKNDTAAGVEFGQYNSCRAVICGTEFIAATPDLSHVLISSSEIKVQLTPEEAPEGGLYEWSNGTLRLVSSELPAAGFTRTVNGGRNEQRFGPQAISADGERVILGGESSGAIYVHEMSTGANTRVDEPEGGSGTSGSPQFAGASNDGSKIFFIDNSGLTAASSASGSDLYEYDMDKPAGERLTDLSVDTNSGEAANVRAVFGESKDSSYVYFVAGGVLAPGAAPSACAGGGNPDPDVATCNIYVRHDGVTSLVGGELNGSVELARVSPDGHWLAFTSSGDMTGYDTRDAITGEPDQEVYLYDALGKRLICASCDQTKARPVGAHAGDSVAASVPAWNFAQQIDVVPYQPRYLSDGGRLFFNSYDALVPQDVDGTEDVYEFEPPGGRCTASASTYVEAMGGCLGLISSGTSSEESSFVDASESGGDAFFRTAAKLAPQDFDTAMDIYDAHECSIAVPCFPAAPVSPPTCTTGDACKSAPTPQPGLFGPAPSATFSGLGNVSAPASAPAVKPKPLTRAQKLSRALKTCRTRRSRQRRRSCEAAARKRYGHKAGKANSKKKGGR